MSAATKLSWASAASSVKAATALECVQLDGQAILKIVKHCQECQPSLVTGQLLGLDVGATLEVTNCFPFPSRAAEDGAEDDETDGASYQLEMMRCLREVNVDNNTVGWYQSTYLGSYQTVELIETFLNYQDHIKRCVCLIYDPVRSVQGSIALKALRLTEAFMEVYRTTEFTAATLADKSLSWNDIFQEIPITVSNSALVSATLGLCAPEAPAQQGDFDQLGLSMAPFLEKNLEFLNECMDDLASESQKVAYHVRSVARQQAQQAAWITKRRAENANRRASGQEPLPEEEPGNPLFKPLPEPSRLDGFLIVNQVSNYCTQIEQYGAKSLQKLYTAEGLAEQ